jgi:hypothetical protein
VGHERRQWMTEAKLRALWDSNRTYDQIAAANQRSQGWRPSRAAVKRKFERMGLPPRYARHHDLLPWRVRPEHNASRLRLMLQAESRNRQGLGLSPSDRSRVNVLNDLLFGRGAFLVVAYSPVVGFYLTERLEVDQDIIRQPHHQALADQLNDLSDHRTDH